MNLKLTRIIVLAGLGVLRLAAPESFCSVAAAQTATVGGGLDCNGWSPISPNVTHTWPCIDPHSMNTSKFLDNGWYIGHDEPGVQFFSTRPGSGSNMAWRIRLPQQDPIPTQSGSSVATFELTRGYVFGLALCDPRSYPQQPCTPDSDSNTSVIVPTDAGSAGLELFFFPPGYPPLFNQLSCDTKHWCAGLGINSLECDFNFNCNPNCTEPGNGALLQDNGIPTGPPGPGEQTDATYTPNAHTLLMNPGDDVVVVIRDTQDGVLTLVIDLTTGKEGFMVASAQNGFGDTDFNTCQTYPFSFHPEFSTASPQNGVPWAAQFVNVNFWAETGHFELGANADADADDSDCFTGPTIAGCLLFNSGGDLDYDGPEYLPDWPDGSRKHPSPVLIGALNGKGIGPMSADPSGFEYSYPYPTLQFKTSIALSETGCSFTDGVGCVVPPPGAAFYPFFSQLGSGSGCRMTIGNDIPGLTTNDFGKDAQYGASAEMFGYYGFGNFGPMIPNPCIP
jgi:hypothetical protein